ncbi:hypothetical protein EZV62_000719 [Acer yangbiense]|uniref:Uncharacterized protein n=1 Tax=Acer yangbiense TaxID=1000413 RepID=A0A5C7IS30_9ROSI|nr:hypothetical protein EZV62_000719 [Acer yangbiense]
MRRLAHIKLSSSEYHHQQHGFGELSMGNEMGNNNSSGLQEAENTNTGGDQGKSLQDAGHGVVAQVENHIVPVGEGKDYKENETRLDSDAPDSQIVNQIFDEKEKEETEVHDHSAGSTEVEVKSNDEVGDGTNEIQPTTSSSEDSNEKPLLSSSENNLSQLNDLKLEKQTSIQKVTDDEEMINNTIFDTKSSSNDLEPQELVDSKSDQPDQLADPSVQDSNESRLEIEDILGLNLTCISEENGHLIDDNLSKDIGDSSVSVSGVTQEVEIKRNDLSVKEMASKGDEIGQKSVMKSELQSGMEIKCNGDLPTETNAIRSDSSEAELEAVSLYSHLQVSETIDNSVAFTAATILVGKESEHGEDKPDPCPAQSYEESVKGSEIDNASVSQPELVMIESECENSNKRATDYTCSDSGNNRDCVEEANVSQSELVMIEPEPVNNEKGATDYASSDPGINEHNIEEANLSQSELVMIEPELVNREKGAADYASSDPGINKDSIEEANVSRSELVMIEPELVNREKGAADYASSDPGINKDSIEEANVSRSELVMIEPELVNREKGAADYASSDPGINKDSIEEANVSRSELVMIEPELVNREKGAADYASSDPGINKDSIEEANVSRSELVMIEPELVNSEKGPTDYASSDPGINKDSIEEANVSRSELVVIEPELVNSEKGATDYASSDPGINKDSIEEANGSQSELVMIETETGNYGTRATDYTFCDSGIKNCIEEAKVAENGHLIDEASTEQHKGSIEEAVMVPESGVVLTESSLNDCKIEEAFKEKKIVDEVEKNEASYGIENNTEVSGSGNQCMPPTLPVEQTEVFLPESELSLIQPQDNQQNIERKSEKIKSSNESISELKQENCGEFLVTEVSSFDSKNLIAETSLSVAELTNEKPGEDVSEYTIIPAVTVAECNPPANSISGQCASESYQARESVGRDSTESNPNNSSIQAQMQKSPSFGLDLRIEARSEESDLTPLLYQDKTAIEDFSTQAYISLGNSIEHTHNGQDKDMLDTQAMPVEEKVVRMERSDSEKSKNPFLGFLKEEEEVHILITPQKQVNNNNAAKKGNKEQVTLTSPKSKEKRRPRSSLFTNCMCCTTVIN